jgi:hypothetical protein
VQIAAEDGTQASPSVRMPPRSASSVLVPSPDSPLLLCRSVSDSWVGFLVAKNVHEGAD